MGGVAAVLLLGVALLFITRSQGTPAVVVSPTSTPVVGDASPTGVIAIAISPTEAQPTNTQESAASTATIAPVVAVATDTAVAPTTAPAPTDTPQPLPTAVGLCGFDKGVCIREPFLAVWQKLGGKDKGAPGDVGAPLEDATKVGGVLTQRFERSVMQESLGAKPWGVEFANLGVEDYEARHGPVSRADAAIPGCLWFPETGHSVCEDFLAYWQDHAKKDLHLEGDSASLALLLFGYPITDPISAEPIDGKTLRVQWFQKARFESDPDCPVFCLKLGLLGVKK